MGQYYKVAYKNNNTNEVYYYTSSLGKLMENTCLSDSINTELANVMYKNKIQLAFVGDYAAPQQVSRVTNKEVSKSTLWDYSDDKNTIKNDIKHMEFQNRPFNYSGKFLINHTKNTYISFDDYLTSDKISPFTILTALGNGKGGGDYGGKNEFLAGTWAWDVISIEDTEPTEMRKETAMFSFDW